MDEIVGQTPLKDLSQIQLVLMQMPTRALHKLQVSINHEVQSRAHKDLVELQGATENRDALEIVYEHTKSETQEKNGVHKRIGEESGRNLREDSTGHA
jgi:hypothetical protein